MKYASSFFPLFAVGALAMGCGDGSGSGSGSAASASGATTSKPATTAAATTAAPAAKPPPEGAVNVAKLQADFKADEKKWTGQKVKVYGLYLNTNTTKSGGKETYNIVVVDEKGKMDPSVSCYVAASPADLRQYDAVVVEGTIEKLFGASLKDCTYTKR